AGRFDLVISISSSLEVRRERLIERGLKSYEIDQRIGAQATDEDRASISNLVIENNGTVEELEKAIRELWEREIMPRISK
ncbi:MAG: dephospho-CoA kinase, partial [Candidatus Nanopelagicaceae bacterium]